MNNAYIILTLMSIILFIFAYRKNKHIEGMKEAKKMFLNVLPLLLLAFIIAGYLELLLPKESLRAWLGDESGWRGLIIGPVIGALVQGGPFTFFPLFDAVFRQNVNTGTAVAMITAWGMINIGHLPWELAFLGPRFVVLKYSIYIALPSLAGLLASILFSYPLF